MAREPNLFRLSQLLGTLLQSGLLLLGRISDVPATLRSCPDTASKRSLGVWDRYGRSQRRDQLLALCCRDRLGGNVNDDAPLDPARRRIVCR
jgi:hypothetical protein